MRVSEPVHDESTSSDGHSDFEDAPSLSGTDHTHGDDTGSSSDSDAEEAQVGTCSVLLCAPIASPDCIASHRLLACRGPIFRLSSSCSRSRKAVFFLRGQQLSGIPDHIVTAN